MKRKAFSVIDASKVGVLDVPSGHGGREMRYESAQCIADMFNQYASPRRQFVVIHDGHPVRRRAGRMKRFYENLEKLRV